MMTDQAAGIVIATHNLHKIREFKEMFKLLLRRPLDLLSLHQFPEYGAPEENGATFEENASIKALAAAKALNRWVIADDSGLVVPSLNFIPGVHSQRYAGCEATDADNRKKLLKEMQHLQGMQRTAYFECCLILASPEGIKKSVTGRCEGEILLEERGRNGFGYDSLFAKQEYDKSFAELDESTKNRISHRRKAFEKLLVSLETIAF
jgi:XTP/dITP diphosphohydrolase